MNRNYLQTTSSKTIRFDDVSFSVQGKPVSDTTYFRDGKDVFAAYLEQDPDCDNPLEESGSGSIYTARRNSSTLAEFYAALGCDRDGHPDVSNPLVLRISSDKFATRLAADKGFGEQVMQHLEVGDLDGLKREIWNNYFDPYRSSRRYFHQDFPDTPEQYPTDLFEHSAWLEARAAGLVGNPFLVVLDVYEHVGTMYSVSGEGQNCNFDTARGAAVWVPGAYREEQLWKTALAAFKVSIDEKAAIYEWQPSETGRDYGNGIKQDLVKVEDAVVTVLLDGTAMSSHLTFEDARDAAIKGLGRRYDPAKGFEAAQAQAKEFARLDCELYSAWNDGECFSTVVETWKIVEDVDGDILAKFVSDQSIGGYVGRTQADVELDSALNAVLPA